MSVRRTLPSGSVRIIFSINQLINNIDYFVIVAEKQGTSYICGICHGMSGYSETGGNFIFVDTINSKYVGNIKYNKISNVDNANEIFKPIL